MTFRGGQRDAMTTARVNKTTIRDAGPSTAMADYATSPKSVRLSAARVECGSASAPAGEPRPWLVIHHYRWKRLPEHCHNLGSQQPTAAQNKGLELRAGQRLNGKRRGLCMFEKTIDEKLMAVSASPDDRLHIKPLVGKPASTEH